MIHQASGHQDLRKGFGHAFLANVFPADVIEQPRGPCTSPKVAHKRSSSKSQRADDWRAF